MMEYLTHQMEPTMSLILNIRYEDLEHEKRICQELLDWSNTHNDTYGQAFALTYLGDYSLAICNEEEAGKHLLSAINLLENHQDWLFLHLQVNHFLGIYHDIRMDEQGAINCYLKAISVAEILGDGLSESVVLNNLASAFLKHRCYSEALGCFLKADQLQAPLNNIPFRPMLLSNLADCYLRLGELQEAKRYTEACEQAEKEQGHSDIQSSMGWCCYYATIGDKEQALLYAQRMLNHQEAINEDKLTAFDRYYTLCEKILDLGDRHYCEEFFRLLEKSSITGSLERMKRLEDIKMLYVIQFGMEQQRDEAYRRFYLKSQLFHKQAMAITTEAMKSKIYLDELLQQTKRMRSEQQDLERDVQLDELTAIYNRRFMEDMMRRHTEGTNGDMLNIIILDVDYFKEYNDYYGHMQGDMVLKEVALSLKTSKPDGIYPCRFGGDEFVCLCQGVSTQKTETYIHNVRDSLHAKAIPHAKSPCSSIVTLSIGYVVEMDSPHTEAHLLFQFADQALYESKRAGRNTYTRNKASLI